MSRRLVTTTLPTEGGFRAALLLGCGVAVGTTALAATTPVKRDAATPDGD